VRSGTQAHVEFPRQLPDTELAGHPPIDEGLMFPGRPVTPKNVVGFSDVLLGPGRLMLQFMRGSNPANRRAAGLAAIQGDASVYACIYPTRIRDLSRDAKWEFGDLLGHAVAREIGHLRLNSSGHSNAGIMRARWEAEDLRRLSHQGLVFLPRQLDAAHFRLQNAAGRHTSSLASR
jgi:hypothetical protein